MLLRATLIAAVLAGAPAVGDARYVGRTSQGASIAIETSTPGTAIGAIATAVDYDGRCGPRADRPRYQLLSYTEVALGSGGRFSFTTTAVAEGRGPQTLSLRIAGAFAGRTVRGTLAAVGRGARCGSARANPYTATFTARVAGSPSAARRGPPAVRGRDRR